MPDQIAAIKEASGRFCQTALLENLGPAATMSGNTKARLRKMVDDISSLDAGTAHAHHGDDATRRLQTAVTRILVTSSQCEEDLARLLTQTLFPAAYAAGTAINTQPLPAAGLVGHYTGSVTNVTRLTSGSIVLDISDDDTVMAVHMHTEIATANDADLQVTSFNGPTLEASGPLHTSRDINYTCELHIRRSGGVGQGAVLKGGFEIEPVSALGSRQEYEFEVTKSDRPIAGAR